MRSGPRVREASKLGAERARREPLGIGFDPTVSIHFHSDYRRAVALGPGSTRG